MHPWAGWPDYDLPSRAGGLARSAPVGFVIERDFPMVNAAPICRAAVSRLALACSALLLVGCEYSATVRNMSRRTVIAELAHDKSLSATVTRITAKIEPGDEAVLGPYRIDPLEPMTLRVRNIDDAFGGTLSERLGAGHQVFIVEDGTVESWGSISIRRDSD